MTTTIDPLQQDRDFWYDFDNQTLFRRTDEVDEAIQQAYVRQGMTPDSVSELLRASFSRPDHPQSFIDGVAAGKNGFLALASIQLTIMDAHLPNPNAIQRAFEHFGQGVLFDDRPPRPSTRRIHMMDGTRDTWVGWQRWHGFMRAATLLGADADRWLHLNRCMALAWAIQTEANPEIDNPANPGLPDERLALLRAAWMSLSIEQLDWAFASHRYRAPTLDALVAAGVMPLAENVQPLRYARVQQILDDATGGTANPIHSGHGRFWLLPLADLLALPPIYDQPLFADPGPDRGARSAMVKILKGELPDFPRMPLDRPPVSDDDIQYIQDWIDAGFPE